MGGKVRQKLPEELIGGVWPMRGLAGHAPRESDGFQRPGPNAKRGGKGHLGHDFMYRNAAKAVVEARPEVVKWYFCPNNSAQAVSPVKGVVGTVQFSKTQGWWVEVKHGRFMSVFRHLVSVSVSSGDALEVGELVGLVGHAPKAGKRGINHLHWELWDLLRAGPRRRAHKVVDATQYLRKWKKLPQLEPGS